MDKLQFDKEYTREDMKNELIKKIEQRFKSNESYDSTKHRSFICPVYFNIYEIKMPIGAQVPNSTVSLIKISSVCNDTSVQELISESNRLYNSICEFSHLENSNKLIENLFNKAKKGKR